ncbi:sensor histidine kinase [Paenibacillus hodogayensis]|uniref:Sensor histidine kinase n=1 Tax=Paenibacillus hodogayensis TaxID=279208 RepID=A0ABV5W6R9_9BACL
MGLTDGMRSFLNKSIANRMIVYFSLFGTLLLIVLGAVNYYESSTSLESEIVHYTTEMMEQTEANLDLYVNDAKTPIALLSTNSSLIASLRHYQDMSWVDRLAHNQAIEELTFNINTFKSYIDDILVIGRNGYVNNLYSGKYMNTSYPFFEQQWVRDALNWKESQLQIIGLHRREYYTVLDRKYNTDTVSVALPIFDENREAIGVVICDLNLDKIGDLLPVKRIADNQQLFLLDGKGQILFDQGNSRVGEAYEPGLFERINAGSSGRFRQTIDGQNMMILYTTSEMTGWKIVTQVPMNLIYHHANKLQATTYISILFAIAAIIGISTWISVQLRKPLKLLVSRMKQVEAGNFTPKTKSYGYGEVQLLGDKFENMVAEINRLITENYESRIVQQESEFKALQAQINPHFLFNTLQLIQTEIVCENYEESSELLVALSHLFRYSMDYTRQVVTLREELDYIGSYLNIYTQKYKGRLHTSISADPLLETYAIPKLILQPIVENCIVHGFADGFHSGKITVDCVCDEEGVLIRIADNGIGMTEEQLAALSEKIGSTSGEGSRIGLRNVQQRIKMKYGEEYGMSVSGNPRNSTIVDIRLPGEMKP